MTSKLKTFAIGLLVMGPVLAFAGSDKLKPIPNAGFTDYKFSTDNSPATLQVEWAKYSLGYYLMSLTYTDASGAVSLSGPRLHSAGLALESYGGEAGIGYVADAITGINYYPDDAGHAQALGRIVRHPDPAKRAGRPVQSSRYELDHTHSITVHYITAGTDIPKKPETVISITYRPPVKWDNPHTTYSISPLELKNYLAMTRHSPRKLDRFLRQGISVCPRGINDDLCGGKFLPWTSEKAVDFLVAAIKHLGIPYDLDDENDRAAVEPPPSVDLKAALANLKKNQGAAPTLFAGN